MSSWIVTELGGVPHAVNLAVQTIEGLELPVGARAVVPDGASETGAWVVVADERGRIARVPIGGATAGAGAVVAVAEQVRAEVGRAAAAGGGGGAVAAVGGGGGAIVAAATPKAMTVSERLAQRSKGAAPGPASASAPATQPPSPTAVGANVDADDDRRGAVGRDGSAVPAVVLVERRTLLRGDVEWRRRVIAWAREGHDGVPEAPPIEDLASRAGIGPAGASVLAALYADWLEGNGERGIAAAVAAEVAGDDGAAWREALGTGQLASLGMVVAELGRVRLLPSVGTWLDGRAPRCIEILAATREPGALVPPEGAHRVAAQVGESARACAERLASAIGGVALCELEGQGLKAARQWADQGRLEGWLRDLAVATPIDLGVITPRPGERVLAIAAAGTLESAGLPWWKVAR
jgi:hypothetical protein